VSRKKTEMEKAARRLVNKGKKRQRSQAVSPRALMQMNLQDKRDEKKRTGVDEDGVEFEYVRLMMRDKRKVDTFRRELNQRLMKFNKKEETPSLAAEAEEIVRQFYQEQVDAGVLVTRQLLRGQKPTARKYKDDKVIVITKEETARFRWKH